MFKFRRPSICSDLEIVSDSDSVSDVTDEIQKGVTINSISDSKASVGSVDSESKNKRNVNGEDCEAISNERERFHDPGEERCRQSSTTDSSKDSGPSSMVKLGNNPNLPSEHIHVGCLTTLTTAAAIMCDRKRKERHESCSQGQEKKVIRSLSHDDPKLDVGGDKGNDFRRTQSNDNFQPNMSSLVSRTNETEDDLDVDVDISKQIKQIITFHSKPLNSVGSGETKQNFNQTQPQKNYGSIDSTSYGVGSTTNPQYGIVRNMPLHFEAELQRQWERSAQWSSNSSRKMHSGRKHRSRSGKSSSVSTPTRNHPSDCEVEDDSYGEGITVDSISGQNEDELNSPSSEDSTSSSTVSLDDMENQRKLCLNIECDDEDIQTGVGPELSIEKGFVASSGLSNSSSRNPNSFETGQHLDFSTLHHHVETTEPISFLAALQTTGIEDQVMLSPRNSVLIKETVDVPPSPPLYQAPLDPPVSRQHGGNHNMKMNQLSKQISNMKRYLKTLEDEYEQHFGYKPSQADKLNQKEMRKCLLQLTKAKRELKQMKEDPAALRIGGNLLQVMNLSVGQIPYARNSGDTLRSLDETVNEINKTMSDKRRAQCRPEDPVLMTPLELTEEKNAMQKQLLMLEKRHGRPGSKEEKDIVRSLYDRYRSLKKTGTRMGNIKENSIDLAPILEHETLEFAANNASENVSNIEPVKDFLLGENIPTLNSPKERRRRILVSDEDVDDEASLMNIRNEGFTDMSLVELEARQKSVREDKRKLRTVLRKFETDFQTATGRPPQKDEKYSSVEMESIYQKYKRSRATVRLLDVLIAKRKFPQLLADINKSED